MARNLQTRYRRRTSRIMNYWRRGTWLYCDVPTALSNAFWMLNEIEKDVALNPDTRKPGNEAFEAYQKIVSIKKQMQDLLFGLIKTVPPATAYLPPPEPGTFEI